MRVYWIIACFAIMAVILAPRKLQSSGLEGYGIKVPYSSTLKIGKWSSNYKDGNTEFEMSYLLGYPQTCRSYYPNKMLRSAGNFKKGKPFGQWVSYYPNGNVESINVYQGSFASPSLKKLFFADGSLIFHSEGGAIVFDREPRMENTLSYQPAEITIMAGGSHH